jgi:hypothetical protein
MVLGASGLLAAGLASSAYAATTASTGSTAKSVAAQAPAWRTVFSAPNNGLEKVIATGRTTGWAFQEDGSVAYERTGASWKAVAFPGTGGVVKAAGASSPSDVWAAYVSNGVGTQLDHWNGRTWTTATTFPNGSVTAVSALSPRDVWVFGGLGSSGVFHFNGRTWTEVSATLQLGSALSDHNVWAFNGTEVEHYNGRS